MVVVAKLSCLIRPRIPFINSTRDSGDKLCLLKEDFVYSQTLSPNWVFTLKDGTFNRLRSETPDRV